MTSSLLGKRGTFIGGLVDQMFAYKGVRAHQELLELWQSFEDEATQFEDLGKGLCTMLIDLQPFIPEELRNDPFVMAWSSMIQAISSTTLTHTQREHRVAECWKSIPFVSLDIDEYRVLTPKVTKQVHRWNLCMAVVRKIQTVYHKNAAEPRTRTVSVCI